jgi:hypothetical protein
MLESYDIGKEFGHAAFRFDLRAGEAWKMLGMCGCPVI